MALVETKTEDGVGVITINRPDALNAVNSEVMDGLLSAAAKFDADPAIGCILITGEGKAFIAGADISEFGGKRLAEADHAGLGCRVVGLAGLAAQAIDR